MQRRQRDMVARSRRYRCSALNLCCAPPDVEREISAKPLSTIRDSLEKGKFPEERTSVVTCKLGVVSSRGVFCENDSP